MAYKNAKYGYVWDQYKNITDTLNLKSRDDVKSRNFDSSLKYLQGGLINLQQQMLLLFIQAIAQTLQTDPQQIAQAAQLNPQALETAVLVFQLTQDIQQAAQAFVLSFLQQVQAARHGAKLNYIRQLKHQCPEGQELVYYKQGGMVKCGCAGKKFEDGGKTLKNQSAVEKFKSRRKLYEEDMSKVKDEAARDSIRANKYNDLDVLVNRPGRYVNGVWTPDRTKSPYNKSNRLDPKTTKTLPGGKYPSYWTTKERGIWEREHGDNEQVENINRGYKKNEKGGKVKKHENGGSLNGISFYQEGTPKGGVSNNTLKKDEDFSLWELAPVVGSVISTKRAIKNPTASNIGAAAMSIGSDLLIGGGPTLKALLKYNKIRKALQAQKYFKISSKGNLWMKIGSKPVVNSSPGMIVGSEPVVTTKTLNFPTSSVLKESLFYLPESALMKLLVPGLQNTNFNEEE